MVRHTQVTRIALLPKIWGSVRHIFDNNACAVSVLSVEKGGYSSNHFHRERVNRFLVISGVIEIVMPESRVRLSAGDVYDVPPNMVHRFEVLESGIVVEVYWPQGVSFDDIVRLDTGGITK